MGASTPKTFVSTFRIVKDFPCDFSQDEIKNEPMFFNSSTEFALAHGGPITKSFIYSLPGQWLGGVLDTRVHMLMPGWYPAIPGYHHDDVPRPPIPIGQHFITAGQPDYDNPQYKSQHIMGLVNAEICPTYFASGVCEMPAIPEGELIYRRWHKEVEKRIKDQKMILEKAESGQLIEFDWQTFHSCSKAVGNGWRWFGRISRNTDRVKNITNEIRRQVQVYLEFPMHGW